MNEEPIREILASYRAMNYRGRYRENLQRYVQQIENKLEKGKIHQSCRQAWEIVLASKCIVPYQTEEEFYEAIFGVKVGHSRDILFFLEENKNRIDDISEYRNALSSFDNGVLAGKYRLAVLKERIVSADKGRTSKS